MKKIFLSLMALWAVCVGYIIYDAYFVSIRPTTARIDVYEKTTNSEPCFNLVDKNTGKEFYLAEWMPRSGLQGYVVAKNGNDEELEIIANSDNCRINFALRGPWKLKDANNPRNGLKEKWVEYTGFSVNGENVIKRPVDAWHNKPVYHEITAQKGNIFNIKMGWKKYYTPEQKTGKTFNAIGISFTVLIFLCLICYKFRKTIHDTKISQKMLDFDIEEFLISKWKNTPRY